MLRDMRTPALVVILAWCLLVPLGGCGEELPADVAGYAERCVKMNAKLIEPTDDDPHEGYKNVYACNIEAADLLTAAGAPALPYPDGTMIVKESSRENQDYVWLIATARKQGGAWRWDEYTRNFPEEEFVRIAASEKVCIDCHTKVEAADFIYTVYQPGAGLTP